MNCVAVGPGERQVDELCGGGTRFVAVDDGWRVGSASYVAAPNPRNLSTLPLSCSAATLSFCHGQCESWFLAMQTMYHSAILFTLLFHAVPSHSVTLFLQVQGAMQGMGVVTVFHVASYGELEG